MLLLQSRFVDSYYVINSLLLLLYVPLTLYFRLLTPDGSDYGRVQSLHEFGTWVGWRSSIGPFAHVLQHSA